MRFFQAKFWAFGLALFLIVLTAGGSAFAVLGGDVVSVQNDAVQMKANLQTTTTAAYTRHEMHAPTGTVVREYASPAGKVFAVGWQGPHTPDMRQLLGSYFPQFEQAVAEAHRNRVGRRPLFIQQPGLTVQLGGHMRAFSGKVVIPDMVPQGVHAEELR